MSDTIVAVQPVIQTVTVMGPPAQYTVFIDQMYSTYSDDGAQADIVHTDSNQMLLTNSEIIDVLTPNNPVIQTVSTINAMLAIADNTQVNVLTLGMQGPAGPGVPVGGVAGQYLRKNSAADFDMVWASTVSFADIPTYTMAGGV